LSRLPYWLLFYLIVSHRDRGVVGTRQQSGRRSDGSAESQASHTYPEV
jgi:hypothetical protein